MRRGVQNDETVHSREMQLRPNHARCGARSEATATCKAVAAAASACDRKHYTNTRGSSLTFLPNLGSSLEAVSKTQLLEAALV